MKNNFFLILFFLFSYNCFSQETANEEYEIYAKIIGIGGLQFYPINFEIPINLKFEIDDPIYKEIEKIHIKPINQKKIFDLALKYSINKTFRLIESDQYKQIYFSSIYFKNKDEAYFLYVIKTNFKKPYHFFMQAKKIKNEWILSDYYIIN